MFQALERRLVFRTVTHSQYWKEAPAALRAEDVWLPLGKGETIHGWWCPPPNWTPFHGAVLYCSGYKGNVSQRDVGIAGWQEHLGQGVLAFDYPGYGRSTGKPSEAACYAAADAACDWLAREKGVAPQDVLFYGTSLGGGVAIELATRRPYRALVLLATFTSLPDAAAWRHPWLPVRWLLRSRFDNLAKIGRTPGRIFLAHGAADRSIPFGMAERLFAAAREPKHLLPLPGHEHHHLPGPEFYAELATFLHSKQKRASLLGSETT
jgi:uncharacterized protein